MKQQELIDQIHNEFDTAQDRLLKQANEILSNPVNMKDTAIETIGERLKKVGFINAPTAKKSDEIKGKKNAIIKQLVETREQAELIEYYKCTYPFLKFLTESELDRICKKYNLVYAPTENYIEEVPEKNLRDIETAQTLKQIDHVADKYRYELDCYSYVPSSVKDWFKEFESIEPIQGDNRLRSICPIKYDGEYLYRSDGLKITKISKSGLFIAAPSSHFNNQGLVKKGFGFFSITKVEVKDPIVFRYVKGGIQVLTKWGLEANDPALVVPVLN